MKQLFILLTAFSLFASACNNDKTASRDSDTKTKTTDDYRDNKEDDDKSKDDDKTSRDDDNTSSKGWSAREINEFTTNCVSSASAGDNGMVRAAAQKYCDCMLDKLQKLYPNANDAAFIDMESESMKQMVQDCLN